VSDANNTRNQNLRGSNGTNGDPLPGRMRRGSVEVVRRRGGPRHESTADPNSDGAMPEMPNSVQNPDPLRNDPVNDEIDGLRRTVATLERDLAALARHVPGAKNSGSSSSGRAVADAMWKCRKCNSLLGFYDVSDDILRVREKLQPMFVKVGGADVDAMAKTALAIGAIHEISPDIIGELMTAVSEHIDPGLVQVVCRHCSAVNTQHYAQPTTPSSPG
jgi:hypothetical protein